MSNYSGFSQASNLSGISSISRSTSIRGNFLRVDNNSLELSGQTNITGRIEKGSVVANSNKRANFNQYEDLTKSFHQCQEIISDYGIKKLIHECVKEASLNTDDTVKPNTAKKLTELLSIYEIEKYLHLPNSSSDDINEKITLLGITDLPKVEINYEEKLEIKKFVEKKLREKTKSFVDKFEEMGGNVEELMKKAELQRDREMCEIFEPDLLQWKEKIEQECSDYEKDILEYKKYFIDWINLKHGDMNDVQLKKAESLLIKVQVSEAQAKITKLNCILKMFKDTPFTLEAYQMINSNLEKEIIRMDEEIKRKETVMKLYQELSGTEYDQIVQRYSELCKAIEKKKRIMEDLC